MSHPTSSSARLHAGFREEAVRLCEESDPQPCVLTFGIEHARGLRALIEATVRDALDPYEMGDLSPDSLDRDDMAVASRTLDLCSDWIVLLQDGRLSFDEIKSRQRVRVDRAARHVRLLLEVARHGEEHDWPVIDRGVAEEGKLHEELDGLTPGSDEWLTVDHKRADARKRVKEYRQEMNRIEDVIYELLCQLVPAIRESLPMPSDFEAEQWHDARQAARKAVAA